MRGFGKGATVIMHSGTGEGMHADGEYVVWQSVEELARIQIEPEKSGECLKRRNTGQRQGQKRRQNRCFPLYGRWRREAMEEEEISCVSGEGLAFAEASFGYHLLLRFGSRAASSKLQLLPNFAG